MNNTAAAAAAAASAEPVSHGDRNAEVVLECRDVYPQDGRVPAHARRRDTHDVCRVTRDGIGYLLEPLVANQPRTWQLHVKESPGSGSTTWSRDSVCAHKCALAQAPAARFQRLHSPHRNILVRGQPSSASAHTSRVTRHLVIPQAEADEVEHLIANASAPLCCSVLFFNHGRLE